MTTINSSGSFESTQGVVWELDIDGDGTSSPVIVTFDPSASDGLTADINIGTMTVNAGSIVNMDTNVNNIYINNIVLNGGTLVIDPSIVGTKINGMPVNEGLTIQIGASGGKLLISQTADTNASIPLDFLNGNPGNFEIGFLGATSVSVNYNINTNTTYYVANDGRTEQVIGNPYSLPESGTVTTYTQVGPDGTIMACFLAGAMIATPAGDRLIEELAVGDMVLALVDGQWVSRQIVALKTANAHASGVPSDVSGHPVRIQRGAIAPSVPNRDLWVTAEHCFLFEGKFVPVRMLVNGNTIRYDEEIIDYTHYHIELEKHSIINANNFLTESYLDTHSRVSSLPERGHNVVCLRPRYLSWDLDAVAPLETGREFVEAIFRQICARIQHVDVEQVECSRGPRGLWLESMAGMKITPCRLVGGRAVFVVPGHMQQLYLCSSAARPCDVIGPYVDDRRHLGAFVKAIHVFGDHVMPQNVLEPVEQCGNGWLESEGMAGRWTNGRACLDLGTDISKHSYILSIDATIFQENLAFNAVSAA
nr:Hint domain-containing protein [uncultured Neokomagataea sp.]